MARIKCYSPWTSTHSGRLDLGSTDDDPLRSAWFPSTETPIYRTDLIWLNRHEDLIPTDHDRSNDRTSNSPSHPLFCSSGWWSNLRPRRWHCWTSASLCTSVQTLIPLALLVVKVKANPIEVFLPRMATRGVMSTTWSGRRWSTVIGDKFWLLWSPLFPGVATRINQEAQWSSLAGSTRSIGITCAALQWLLFLAPLPIVHLFARYRVTKLGNLLGPINLT